MSEKCGFQGDVSSRAATSSLLIPTNAVNRGKAGHVEHNAGLVSKRKQGYVICERFKDVWIRVPRCATPAKTARGRSEAQIG